MKRESVIDKNRLTPELNVMIDLLNGKDSSKAVNDHAFSWDSFLHHCFHHRLFPLVHTRLKEAAVEVPERIRQTLAAEYKRNAFNMLFLTSQMETISKAFSERRLRALFLKGPVLAQDLYGSTSERTSHDIDLLVELEDYEKVKETVLDLGYREKEFIRTILGDWKWRHYHTIFIHPKTGVKVEIHWRLHPGPGKEPAFKELWERRRTSTLTTHPVYMLSKEDLFYYLSTHGARHGWSRLRWLFDIRQLIDKEMDWKLAGRIISANQAASTGGQALLLVSCLFNTHCPTDIHKLKTIRAVKQAKKAAFYMETMINIHDEPLAEKIADYHKQYLFSLMSQRQKLLFTLSFMYPYPEDADLFHLPKGLHFLYFPLRPFLWFWRKKRKQALT
ncbi:nucleotidyltransferase domain-containing protein [Alteribacter natronophilus]|uniref:nucleotidyltransferase domain-containing protein n=1 Tax=Alteribacter natronophilus TaxID=2583810 RepID=UPI0014869814|nr:nucleotidyltransferase family protein [Alteribacter natronophilus]